jgi:serine/threonine protein kinase
LDLLKVHKSLGEAATRAMLRQILTGLSALHSHGFVHRDLKPENILISTNQDSLVGKDLRVVVADLGSAIHVHTNSTNEYVTTRFYRSPEMVFKSTYGCEVDIWAVGCVTFEALTGSPLFPAQSEADLVLRMCSVLGSPPTDDERFQRMTKNITFSRGIIPTKFAKQSLARWFQGSNNANPSQSCITLLDKMIQWLPEDRLDAQTALRTELLMH